MTVVKIGSVLYQLPRCQCTQACTLLMTDCNSDRGEENPQLCLWLCELISVQSLSCAHSHFESAHLHSGYHLTAPRFVHTLTGFL